MTAVVFKFVHPDGTPVVDTPFVVSLRKTSFDEKLDVGILLPGDVQGMTDAQGMDTLELMPGFGIFYLTMSALDAVENSDGCIAGLRYRFQVPESDTPVRVEDIIVTTPTFSRPWDETALQVIIDAKIESKQSADAAKASELAAGEFAVRAEDAVAATGENADAAAASALAASQSATTAGDASTAAITARNEAEGFRDQSRTSELAAAGSAATATEQAGLASQEKLQAQEYAEQSEFSAGDAEVARVASVAASEASALSAGAAEAAATITEQDKQATAADRVAVTGLKADVVGLKDETKTYRDEALAAVGTITGAFVDGGLVDLSGGAYPTKPDVSTIWKVQVGGTVTTVKEGTIVYATGDQLVYTKTQDTWYKNVSQSAVTKVAGKTGDVVLEKGDVGLALVDNTADVDKPISTAQQAAFDARTPTTSRDDTTAGRLVKVGDYGENGGAAILKSAADDANAITVPGTYVFNGGGLNLPENTVYIKHFNHATAGYSKQIAYSLQTNKVYVRTLNNGAWTDWGPAVEIVDSLTSADPAKALSARQGKILLEMLQANNATIVRYTFNVAAGQTTITGNSLEGVPLSYVPGVPFMVEKDGFPIWIGNDYTASNGSSITLVEASTIASQVAITVFGAFSAADHYTKAQSDARYYQQSQTYTQAQVADLLAASVGQSFIEGFQLVWLSGTSIQIRAGSAYVPSVGKRVAFAGGNIVPIAVGSANTFVHIYLSAAGTIFQSLTAPERYYNNGWRLTNDGSYRYIGSILINTNALGAYKFKHDLVNGNMWYIHANPTTVPFRFITTVTSNSSMSVLGVVPVTATTMIGTWQNVGPVGTYVYFTPSDAGTPVGDTGWMVYLQGGVVQNSECPISANSQITVGGTGAGWNGNAYCQGYRFER